MHVDDAIRTRKTEKVLSERELPSTDNRDQLNDLLKLAGMAPFHRACEERHRDHAELTGIEPWRFHVLDAATCRKLRVCLPTENAGKIPAMLAAADALIMTTWLPHQGEAPDIGDEPGFAVTSTNMEHIAATAAAIQNLLLAATARGVSNYWSSGGVLRSTEVFNLLGIPRTQILLGAVFLFPSDFQDAQLATSKLREHRGPPHTWARWVSIE